MSRKLLNRRGLAVLIALFLACAAVFYVFYKMPVGTVATVECGGRVVLTQALTELTEPKTIEIDGENGIAVTVVFYPDGARVESSACPDKLCVNCGKLTRAGETAICLPARVTLRLSGNGGVDAATY